MTLVSKKDLPAKDFNELLAWIKANGKKVTIGNAGVGSASHLCGLLFMQAIQTELTPVPYKGTAPAMNDLLGGQIDLMCDQTTNTTSQIKSGKIKVYAVTTPTRLATMKDVPTLYELGLKNFELSAWHGLWAPKGTPKPVVEQLSQGAAGRGQGSRRHAALRRSRRRAGRRGKCDAGGAADTREDRDRALGADHQGRRTVRGLTSSPPFTSIDKERNMKCANTR